MKYKRIRELVKLGKIGDSQENTSYKIVAISPSNRRVVVDMGVWRADGSAHYQLVTREGGEQIASEVLPLDDFINYCGTEWV